MKKYFFLAMLFFPFVCRAQYATNAPGLSDYMWVNAGNPGFSPGEAYGTDLAFSPSGIAHVAFEDDTQDSKLSVMRLVDKNWEYAGSPAFSESGVGFPSIAVSPAGEPYVAYEDFNKYSMATVKKLSGQEWVTVGEPGISVGIAGQVNIAIDQAGTPYVGFCDNALGSKASVVKFDGSTWVNVGLPGISAGSTWYNCLALDASGVPYVAFLDYENNSRMSVMKFDGTNWVYVGAPGFNPGYPKEISLAISPSGQPYVAYTDGDNNDTPSVMKYDETAGWIFVGSQFIVPKTVSYTSLAFSPDGIPYLAIAKFMPPTGPYKASVLKFDGTNWVYVGLQGFSEDQISNPSLAFGSDSKPYLAYVDYGNYNKATVKVYDNEYEEINGPTDPALSFYPNPAKSELSIELKTPPGRMLTYEITDIRGIPLIKARTCENKITVDVHNYPAGIYICRINGADSSFAGKFCKQ